MKLIVIAILLTGLASAYATTIQVPTDQPTIQAGINAASAGDTVLVAAGTYTGDGNRDIDFGGKNITVKGAGSDVTVIDCQGMSGSMHRAFYLHSGETRAARIEGFTIQGAYDSLAAVVCRASVSIHDCILTGNHPSAILGQSVQRPEVWLEVHDCEISNSDTIGIVGWGCCAEIVRTKLLNNNGDGVSLFGPDSIYVSYCLARGNTLAGFHIHPASPVAGGFYNCTSVENGEGMYFEYDPPKLVKYVPYCEVQNCILAFNLGKGYHWSFLSATGRCNDAYGNPGGDFSPHSTGWAPSAGDTLGNISLNPLFCDASTGDFHIMNSSPCAAANNACGVQIGTLEVGCVCCQGVRGNVDMLGTVDLSDLSTLVSYLVGSNVQLPCPDEANVDGHGIIELADLSSLVNYLTGGNFILPACPK